MRIILWYFAVFYIILFVLCHLLPIVHYLCENIDKKWCIYDNQRRYLIMKDVGHLCLAFNASVSFFIYYLYGTKFRNAFRRERHRFLIRFCSCGRRKPSLSGGGATQQTSPSTDMRPEESFRNLEAIAREVARRKSRTVEIREKSKTSQKSKIHFRHILRLSNFKSKFRHKQAQILKFHRTLC